MFEFLCFQFDFQQRKNMFFSKQIIKYNQEN